MKTNVCLYTRVSKDTMDYNRQISDLTAECSAHNYVILQEFSEKETGRHKRRKALDEMLKFCKENKSSISYVMVSEISRLGRTSEVLNTIETLNELKIGLISLKEPLLKTLNDNGTPNPFSLLLTSILTGINSFELDTTKYRSKSGLLYSAQQGNWGGGKYLPYGYMREEKKLVINPVEALIIKQIFEMYLSGKGTLQIATLLQGKGIPTRTGVKWRDKVVYDIICNPLYCGKRIFRKDRKESKNKPARKGESVIIPAPAIITEEMYEEATKKRVSNYSKLGINSKFEYLLNKRLIKCGVCGKSYFAHKRSNNNDNAYKCISIRYHENCGNTSISIDKLEYAVKYIFLFNYVQLVKLENDNSEEINAETLIYEAELKKIKQQSKKLLDLYLETDDPSAKTEYEIKKEELRQKEKKFEELRQASIDRIRDITKAKELIKRINAQNVGQYFEVYEITKDMLQQVIKEIVINKDNKRLTNISNDKTVKVDIHSITGTTITIYLSQRANFFLWNDNHVEYDLNLNQVIQTTGV